MFKLIDSALQAKEPNPLNDTWSVLLEAYFNKLNVLARARPST